MEVDVLTGIEIERPRSEVADYVSDPDNATAWYENINKVEWKSPKVLKVGPRWPSRPDSWAERWPTPMRSRSMCQANRW